MYRSTAKCAIVLLVAMLGAAVPAAASDVGKARVIHDGDGNAVRITVLKTKPVAGSGYFKPKAGLKWFGAYIRVRNLSQHKLDDCAGNDAELTGSNNGQYDEAFLAQIKPELSCFKLLPGRTLEGWVVWEMPKRIKPKFIDWTMDSGFADETATWKL
jgi:hypothetical protein